jgi:hypothetical protein
MNLLVSEKSVLQAQKVVRHHPSLNSGNQKKRSPEQLRPSRKSNSTSSEPETKTLGKNKSTIAAAIKTDQDAKSEAASNLMKEAWTAIQKSSPSAPNHDAMDDIAKKIAEAMRNQSPAEPDEPDEPKEYIVKTQAGSAEAPPTPTNADVDAAMKRLQETQNKAMVDMANMMMKSIEYNSQVSIAEQLANNAMRAAKTEAR